VRVRTGAAWAAVAGVAGFWAAILVAAALEPGYTHRRDYVSTLAAHGAEHAGLAMLAIVLAAGAMIGVALVVGSLSRGAAAAIGLAGVGFVIAAFTRLDCPNGAAGCGLGGRFEVSGGAEIGHWTATTGSTVLLVVGMVLTGVALLRGGRTVAALVTFAAAAVTTTAFLATGGDEPGATQRIGIVVATGWLAALAIATLRAGRPEPTSTRSSLTSPPR
jgi:hypothetical protein